METPLESAKEHRLKTDDSLVPNCRAISVKEKANSLELALLGRRFVYRWRSQVQSLRFGSLVLRTDNLSRLQGQKNLGNPSEPTTVNCVA